MRELNNKIIEYNRLRRRAALKGRAGKDESLTIEQISNSMKSEG
jgi:hypothetical protein